MQKISLRIAALGAALLLSACGSMSGSGSMADEAPPPKNPDFAGEMAKFDAQFPNANATKYEDASIAYNNANKLDEKSGCHDKSKYPVTIILLLDASGKVTRTLTDVENAKAACFRNIYAAAQFPKPPMAPYRKAILLR
jgi:hypothetical protein